MYLGQKTIQEAKQLLLSSTLTVLDRIFCLEYQEYMFFNGFVWIGECDCATIGETPICQSVPNCNKVTKHHYDIL